MQRPGNIVIAVFAGALVTGAGPMQLRAQQPRDASCPAADRSPARLRLNDGRAIYVEPNVVLRSDAAAIVAGEPVHVWQSAPQNTHLDTAHHILGVTIADSVGYPLPIPPASGLASHVRMAADGRGYVAVFATLSGSALGANPGRVLGYWFGRTDGRRWHSVERLPSLPRPLLPHRASGIVRAGSDLLLAVPYGTDARQNVAVYRLNAGRWLMDTLAVSQVAYVTLASINGRAFVYVVHPDTGSDVNSLFLYEHRDDSWRRNRLLVRGGARPVHGPRVVRHHSGSILTWVERDPARGVDVLRASVLRSDGGLQDPVIIARDIHHVSVATHPSGNAWWVATTPGRQGSSHLLYVEWSGDGPVLRDHMNNPFTGPVAALPLRRGPAVAGPVFTPQAGQEVLVTGILRLQPRCAVHVPQEAP